MSDIDDLKKKVTSLELEVGQKDHEVARLNHQLNLLKEAKGNFSETLDGLKVLCDARDDQERFDRLFSDMVYQQLGKII